jgi:septum formation protein
VSAPPLILASTSPRRADILRAEGLDFEVVPSGIDEAPFAALPPRPQALYAAQAKARAVAATHPAALVLGSDTVVALDGAALGKPADDEDAVRMLRLLSGRVHSVTTGVALAFPGGEALGWGTSSVQVAPLSEDWIRRYVATGEPADKAGAYAIQGGAAAVAGLVRGRLDTVVGLPMHVVRRLLRQAGGTAGQ